jgi:hypothetical protein
MPKRTGGRQEFRAFSFRMPKELFDDLETLAKSRGVDVTGLLNWVLSDYRPRLFQLKAEHEAAMQDAAASRVWAKQPTTADALRVLRDLLGTLQEEYAKLVKKSLEEDERRAA